MAQCSPSAPTAPHHRPSFVFGSTTDKRGVKCYAGALKRRPKGDDDNGRRREVLRYVREVQPSEEVQAFMEQSPPTVVAAMKQTVSNMVGTLPPQHFSVTIDTVADSLATLMQTMLRTGYLLRSAQYQLELEMALRGAVSPMPSCGLDGTSDQSMSDGSSESQDLPAAPSPSIPIPASGSNTLMQCDAPPSASAQQPADLLAELTARMASDKAGVDSLSSSLSSSSQLGALGQGASGALSGAAVGDGGWLYSDDEYAPGVQTTKVEGEVLRWHLTHGLERMPAQQYIQTLEAKVKSLEAQLQQQHLGRTASLGQSPLLSSPAFSSRHDALLPAGPAPFNLPVAGADGMSHSNPALAAAAAAAAATAAAAAVSGYSFPGGLPSAPDLLAYLRTLDSSALAALGACSQDVADAMTAFVARLMGTSEREQLRSMSSEFTAVELSKLLFWLLVVGWSLRTLEVRWEMQEGFGPPPSAPPGSSSGGGSGSGRTPPASGNGPAAGGAPGSWLLPGW